MAPLSLVVALAARVLAQEPAPPTAKALLERAGAAFIAGKPVDAAVAQKEFDAAVAAGDKDKDVDALVEALPLAHLLQTKPAAKPPGDERIAMTRRAAKLLGVDEAACLCLYARGECPSALVALRDARDKAPAPTVGAGPQAPSSWLGVGATNVGGVSAGGPATANAGQWGADGYKKPLARFQYRMDFKAKSDAPPSVTPVLTREDMIVNRALGLFNLEVYSRKGTLNRESPEGTKASICGFLKAADYDPGRAWELSKQARDKPGADPGDLDMRNAEHYLYAYSTTSKPAGFGETAYVQVPLAIGWTVFKTGAKYFKATSTPSRQEMGWGVAGAMDGDRKPDWRARCEG